MAINYAKWPANLPNSHQMDQHLPLQDTPKFTQLGIFGLKVPMYHLATLLDRAAT
jgi:hypothetical protein